ncbi:MAG: hypothetical protein ABIY37_15890 [Devosia sp.]
MLRRLGALWLVVISTIVAVAIASAADIPRNETPNDPGAAYQAATHYLSKRALLLMVRSTFDVVEQGDIEPELVADAERLTAAGPSVEELAELDRDLLAEASYYIVSLKYVTLVRGAVWPADRPEIAYANDALVQLDALQEELQADIVTGVDPLPVFERLQNLLLLSEGLKETPVHRDMFAGRDRLITDILQRHGPWART